MKTAWIGARRGKNKKDGGKFPYSFDKLLYCNGVGGSPSSETWVVVWYPGGRCPQQKVLKFLWSAASFASSARGRGRRPLGQPRPGERRGTRSGEG